MKTIILFAFLFLATALSCNKDKFQTVPRLTIKSVTPDVVPVNGNLRVLIEYTDKEGDVNDSLIVVRQRLNVKNPVTLLPSPYKIPDFPDTDKGQFQVNFNYNLDLTFGLLPINIPGSNPLQKEPDTLVLKFVARDRAGNKSDTATANVIVERN